MLFRFAPVLLLAAASASAAPAGDLQATLQKLDAASAHFTSAEASVTREAYTALIKDTDKQQGSLYVIRNKEGKSQVGLRTEGSGARVVEYKDGTVRDYNPATNCFNTINKPGIDTYLSLGFGGSGKELARSWNITDLGPETVSGVKAEKLDLVPKDPSLKQNVTHVTIWIDLDRDVSLKLIFFSPSGDTNTATYSAIRLNKSISTKSYAIKGKGC